MNGLLAIGTVIGLTSAATITTVGLKCTQMVIKLISLSPDDESTSFNRISCAISGTCLSIIFGLGIGYKMIDAVYSQYTSTYENYHSTAKKL